MKSNKSKLRTAHGFVLMKQDLEDTSKQISQTIPNMELSIRELLNKHRAGIEPQGFRDPIYQSQDMDIDDIDMEKVGQYDMFDKEQVLVEIKQRIIDARRKATAEHTAKQERDAAQKEEADRIQEDLDRRKSRSYKYDSEKHSSTPNKEKDEESAPPARESRRQSEARRPSRSEDEGRRTQ